MENYTVASRAFWVTIKVYGGKYPTDQILEIYSWKGPWHVRKKWNWYFKYRAALFQVQNPKNLVEFFCGSKEPDLRTKRDFIIKAERKIEKYRTELEILEDELNNLN